MKEIYFIKIFFKVMKKLLEFMIIISELKNYNILFLITQLIIDRIESDLYDK